MPLVQPNEEQQIIVRNSFNENVDTREKDLDIINQWLKQEPHLPNEWDNGMIMTYLRGCNFSLEKTKKKLDMYFTMRTLTPEFFSNRDITRPELQQVLKKIRCCVMPGLTKDAQRVTVAGGLDIEYSTKDLEYFCKIVFMMGDIRLKLEKFGVVGDIYVIDASIANIMNFVKVNPTIIKKFFICVQEAYPVKVKEVHVINPSTFVEFLLKWLTPFLKEKIRNRIFIHETIDTVYKRVPKEILPEEFGGTAGKIEIFAQKWVETMEAHTDWFKEQEAIKSDESKRLGKPTCHEDLFGLDGSFKKLDID